MAADAMISSSTYIELVDRTFGPLLGAMGFDEVQADDFTVRFEKLPVFVEVTYDPGPHELTVWLDRLEDGAEPPLELADALRATNCPLAEIDTVTLMQSGEPDVLERLMERAAGLLDRCAASFLSGDASAFQAALSARADRARAYTEELLNRRAIAEADEAWQRRDYESVYSGLSPISDSLDATHRRRLEFAASRIANPPAGG